jgi:gamma-glutamyltranspeptidase/glutathione hydrolase/leukotriene-C4 hydrolase
MPHAACHTPHTAQGYIAEELVRSAQERGGIITREDFRAYRAAVKEPIVGTYKGHTLITSPLTTSGPVLLSIMNILEHFAFEGPRAPKLATTVHRVVEAFKHGFAQRSFYGDPADPVYRNISAIQRNLTDKAFAARLVAKISDDRTFPVPHYDSPFDVHQDHGTMHLSVVGRNGDAVSMTSTVNLAFGGQVMNRRTGVILNDEMDDFSVPGTANAFGLVASPYNYVHPHKRPLSSSVPCMVETGGRLNIVIGASGGSRILTAATQALLAMLEHGWTPAQAVQAPRAHHQLLPNKLFVRRWTFCSLRRVSRAAC